MPGVPWVDTFSRLVVQVGFPVVVAAVLLWYLLTKFQANVDVITMRMQGNAEALLTFVNEMETQTSELKMQTQELKAQTGSMAEQSKLMHQIAKDSETLVGLRKQELEWMRSHK